MKTEGQCFPVLLVEITKNYTGKYIPMKFAPCLLHNSRGAFLSCVRVKALNKKYPRYIAPLN